MFEKKDYKKVGYTELRVSPITLGTMTFGDQNSQKEAFEQLDYALDQGKARNLQCHRINYRKLG